MNRTLPVLLALAGGLAAAEITPERLLQAQGDALEARAGGMRYSIDVASYRSKARADQLRGQLAKRGYRAQVEPAADGYRVRLSGFASRDAAQKTARTLSRTMRLDPTVVASK